MDINQIYIYFVYAGYHYKSFLSRQCYRIFTAIQLLIF